MTAQVQSPGLPTALAAGFAAVVAVVAFTLSDNVHSLAESVSFDRLMLGLRFWDPAESRWDLNFPMGTHLVMAVPHSLGLDPVAWGRVVSLGAAGLSTVFAWLLVRRAAGIQAAAVSVGALWCLPAFVRGAVVVGEESLYTACLLGTLWGLQSARRGERFGFLMALLAANATVLFRLDAISVLPGLVAAAALLLGRRRGILFGLGASLSTVLHLAMGWWAGGRWSGDPLGFARVARATTQSHSGGVEWIGDGSLLNGMATQLGALPSLAGWPWLVLCVLGIGWLLRSAEPDSRSLAALTAWLFACDVVLTVLGVLEARTDRYFVPLGVLLTLGGVVAMWGSGERARNRVWMGSVCAVGALLNLGTVAEQATTQRLPDGLHEVARVLGDSVQEGDRVLVGEEHPTLVILGGLSWKRTDVLPAGSPRDSTADRVHAQLSPDTRWVVQVSDNPPTPSLDALSGSGLTMQPVHRSGCCALWEVRR